MNEAQIRARLREILESRNTSLETLRSMYNLYKNRDLKERFIAHASSPHGMNLGNAWAKMVWGYVVEHEQYQLAEHLLPNAPANPRGGVLDIKELAQMSSSNRQPVDLYNLVLSRLKGAGVISQESRFRAFYEEMAQLDGTKGGIAIGSGEILLALFLASGSLNPGKNGDLACGGQTIEVKGNKAMMCGQKKPSRLAIEGSIQKVIKEAGITTADRGVRWGLYEELVKRSDRETNWVDRMVREGLGSWIPTPTYGKSLQAFLDFLAREKKAGLGFANGRQFQQALVALAIYDYYLTDRMDYILFTDQAKTRCWVLDLTNPSHRTMKYLFEFVDNKLTIVSGFTNRDDRETMPKIGIAGNR